jgi:2-desacetyl-2-hydroxyethyl bacteriochlorophyllide A dehydrogenase
VKAAILRGVRDLVLQDIPVPKPRPDEVLIRVKACGICGSDIRYYLGENPWSLHTLGVQKENPPNIALGHEVAGIIESCPEGHPVLKRGMRVGVLAFKGCGKCKYCLTDRENLCEFTEHLGHGAGWKDREFCPGGMAEYCTVWNDKVFELPDSISFDEGVLLDGAAVALHAVKRSNIREGDKVLVNGCGPIGLMVLQMAKVYGAASVTCIDVLKKPLEIAQEVGADHVFLNQEGEVGYEKLRQMAPEGFDVILDSVGSAESFGAVLKRLARGGTLVCLAVKEQSIQLNCLDLAGERTITVSANNKYEDYPEAIRLVAESAVRVQPLITHTFPLERLHEGFDVMLNKESGNAMKVVIRP